MAGDHFGLGSTYIDSRLTSKGTPDMRQDHFYIVLGNLDLRSLDVKFAPLLPLSSAIFPLSYKFLRLFYFVKIGGTGRADWVQPDSLPRLWR